MVVLFSPRGEGDLADDDGDVFRGRVDGGLGDAMETIDKTPELLGCSALCDGYVDQWHGGLSPHHEWISDGGFVGVDPDGFQSRVLAH